MRLRDQLFDDDIDHRPRRKGEHPRHDARHRPRDEHGEDACDRLHDAGQGAHEKRLPLPRAVRAEREGDRGALRKVLQRHADGERDGGGKTALLRSRGRKGERDRHPLGDVVQRDGKHEHGRLSEMRREPFRFFAAEVHMRQQFIEQEQKERADRKPAADGQDDAFALPLQLFHRRKEKGKDGSRRHHAGGKAEEDALHRGGHILFEKEHERGAERRREKGRTRSYQREKQFFAQHNTSPPHK